MFEIGTLLLGIAVFCARVFDVTLGTLRTISIVQGRTRVAFIMGFVEITMWLVVLSTVLPRVLHSPLLALFYSLGFSTGNVVGILVEKRIAMGHSVLRVITTENSRKMAEALRQAGYTVTTFKGEGSTGEVTELYIVLERKSLKYALSLIKSIQPDAFYMTEQAGSVSRVYRPTNVPRTGWRAIMKKK